MGAGNSIPLPRYSCCIVPQNPDRCRENHARAPSTKRQRRWSRRWSRRSSRRQLVNGSLSDGCDLCRHCEDPLYGLLDINTATAEELMTLPGINRTTATNVVEYRSQIGTFRKIEDVALVPGVGATRFGHLRDEICVGSVQLSLPPASSTLQRSRSSATSSGIDVSLTPVDSISREFAATGRPVIGHQFYGSPTNCCDTFPDLTSHCPDNVASIDRGSRLDVGPEYWRRMLPPAADVCRPEDNGILRLAAWNLWPCSGDMADNVGVREVVAMTLLENFVGIASIQGLTEPSVLHKLCDELNNPTSKNVQRWTSVGRRRHWNSVVCQSPFTLSSSDVVSPSSTMDNHFIGFIYDTSQDIQLISMTETSPVLFTGFFTIKNERIAVVMCCVPSSVFQQSFADCSLSDAISNAVHDVKYWLLVGDHSCISRVKDAVGGTVVFDSSQLADVNHAAYNILMAPQMDELCRDKGCHEIIHSGLTSPSIPDSWLRNDHKTFSSYPIWTDVNLGTTKST